MNQNSLIKSLAVMVVCLFSSVLFAEFGTLFTTESERKNIDNSRYVAPKKIVKEKKPDVIAIEKPKVIKYKNIRSEYKISGVTNVEEGVDSVWINGKRYDHGDTLDETIKIIISPKTQQVTLKLSSGKTYTDKSGKTITITTQVPDTQ